MKDTLVIGTRGSDLALWQAHNIATKLQALSFKVSIRVIKTKGDKEQLLSLNKIEGKGFFTKELEDSLLAGTIDVAVHSYKDLPTLQPKGLCLAAITERANPQDLLIANPNSVEISNTLKLKEYSVVGTSSPRRMQQLHLLQHRLKFQTIRGNVPTRIQKLRNGDFDAIILAAAGLERLNIDLSDFKVIPLSTQELIPAPAQGALAVQVRENDIELIQKLKSIVDTETLETTQIERNILHDLNGGCQIAAGIYCKKILDEYHLWCFYKSNEHAPRRFYINNKSKTILHKDALHHLEKKIQKSNVFISSQIHHHHILRETLSSNHVQVYNNSLLHFTPVNFEMDDNYDALFFSSKNSVKFFLQQVPNIKDKKLYSAGYGTTQILNQYGYEVDFTFNEFNQEELKKLVKDKTIMFPRANHSIRTFQKICETSAANIIEKICYNNEYKKEVHIPLHEIAILTSPLNVDAYFLKNIERPKHIIVPGETTLQTVLSKGYNNVVKAYNASSFGYIDAVMSLL